MLIIVMVSLVFRQLARLQLASVTLLEVHIAPSPFDCWGPPQVPVQRHDPIGCSDMTPLGDASITFRHRGSQAYLLYFLSQSWNQPFPQGVLAFFRGKC